MCTRAMTIPTHSRWLNKMSHITTRTKRSDRVFFFFVAFRVQADATHWNAHIRTFFSCEHHSASSACLQRLSQKAHCPQRSQQCQRLLHPRLSRESLIPCCFLCTHSTEFPFGGMWASIFCPSLDGVGTATWSCCPVSVSSVVSNSHFCGGQRFAGQHIEHELLIVVSSLIEVLADGRHTSPSFFPP